MAAVPAQHPVSCSKLALHPPMLRAAAVLGQRAAKHGWFGGVAVSCLHGHSRLLHASSHNAAGNGPPSASSTDPRSASSSDGPNGEAFGFLRSNERGSKPRETGLTEIRGPYYTGGPLPGYLEAGLLCYKYLTAGLPVCSDDTYLRELLEGVGHAVDGLKFAGGSFSVLRRPALQALIDTAHDHGVYVSTGGWMEYALTQGRGAVQQYLQECKALDFDVVELSTGFISLPTEDLAALIRDVQHSGLKAKPELGIQWGAGADTCAAELAAAGTMDPAWVIKKAKRCLEAGAEIIMIESEGITEDVTSWRTDAVAALIDALGPERLMFEAADPKVFSWYVQDYGKDVNLFVDHSQVVQLECLRRGIWGTSSSWGRILGYTGQQG